MRTSAFWTESLSIGDSLELLREFSIHHARLAGPFGPPLLELLERGDLRGVCDFSIDYTRPGLTAESVYHARQCQAFYQKMEDLDAGIDREVKALRAFVDSELHCRTVNEYFRKRASGIYDLSLEPVLLRAQGKVKRILGRAPLLGSLQFRFGPGATTATPRSRASIRQKLSDGVTCSEELFPLALPVLRELPGLCEASARSVVYDEDSHSYEVPVTISDGMLHFVPKNYKTLRTIVVEPSLNGLVQLALGDSMAARLAKFGLNLRDQSANQRAAQVGSLQGSLATLDLSSASDSIASELVAFLLPSGWYDLLSRARSGHVFHPVLGRLTLQKFSSMGNGFTFPLETLIFYAITTSAMEEQIARDIPEPSRDLYDTKEVLVYGDDIVIPTWAVHSVSAALEACGFRINRGKSYSSGPFRESCGKDYFTGFDVRPYYQKDLVSARTLFSLHNFYARRHRWEEASMVIQKIHPSLLLYGPDGYGDGHLVSDDFGRRRSSSHARRGYGGFTFDTFSIKGRRDYSPLLPGDKVLHQYSIYQRASKPLFEFRPTGPLPPSRSAALEEASPLPEFTHRETGELLKATTLPLPSGSTGYKRISIYTFG